MWYSNGLVRFSHSALGIVTDTPYCLLPTIVRCLFHGIIANHQRGIVSYGRCQAPGDNAGTRP
jgi:hypothetical protein